MWCWLFQKYSQILDNNLGAQYGGLLIDYENEVGYSLSDKEIYTKRKECLETKCSMSFKNHPAFNRYLFFAYFLESSWKSIT